MTDQAIRDPAAKAGRFLWGPASAEEPAARDEAREEVSGFVGIMFALVLSVPLWALIVALMQR